MPAVQPTDKAEIVIRASKLLSARMQPLSDQVFVVTNDLVPPTRPNTCLTVSMPGGQFDYGKQIGGGVDSLHYQGTLRVTVWTMLRLDQNGHDLQALVHENVGLFRIWKRILKAFLGSYLDESDTGGSGMILTTAMYAMSDTSAEKMDEEATGSRGHVSNARATMALDFGAEFKVDLSD
jgi:hypothetical protein